MTPLTQEWVDKAEGDYKTGLREDGFQEDPNYDAACFHAQQAAEKYLKARLQAANLVIPYTHDLVVLLQLVLPVEPGWTYLSPDLVTLSVYAVGIRYPGITASRDDARDALKICAEVRAVVRQSLGLP